MAFTDLLERIRHRAAEPNYAIALPPEASTVLVAAPGYFQLRLVEMRLTDERHWGKEIVPATFVLTEFDYGTERARRPFFVSNGLLAYLPQGVNGSQLRVDFRDTLVLGPTPAIGGDIVLFVGLFQMAIGDRLKSAFAILEKLFQVVPGPVGGYLKLADQLAGEISACLGDTNLTCLLGDRSTIGTTLPPAGYHVYLKANGTVLDPCTLSVEGGTLKQRIGDQLVPVRDRDYCLIKVEHLAQREDYASLPFHAVFETARKSVVLGEIDKARLQMLECICMVYGSPDLSEDDKTRLIAFYQAKMLAIQPVMRGAPHLPRASPVTQMKARALAMGGLDGRELAASLGLIGDVQNTFTGPQLRADVPVTNAELSSFLHAPAPGQFARASAETLMKAVAVGSLAT